MLMSALAGLPPGLARAGRREASSPPSADGEILRTRSLMPGDEFKKAPVVFLKRGRPGKERAGVPQLFCKRRSAFSPVY